MRKKLSEINRDEWISFCWIEDTQMEDDRVFVAFVRRTPDEAMQAMEEWDATAEERNACEKMIL